jgi:hypothetical protein
MHDLYSHILCTNFELNRNRGFKVRTDNFKHLKMLNVKKTFVLKIKFNIELELS